MKTFVLALVIAVMAFGAPQGKGKGKGNKDQGSNSSVGVAVSRSRNPMLSSYGITTEALRCLRGSRRNWRAAVRCLPVGRRRSSLCR